MNTLEWLSRNWLTFSVGLDDFMVDLYLASVQFAKVWPISLICDARRRLFEIGLLCSINPPLATPENSRSFPGQIPDLEPTEPSVSKKLFFLPAVVSRESYHHWVFSQPKTGWCSTLTLLRLFARHRRENGHLLLADWSSTFGTTLASTGGRHRGNLQRKVETYRRICTSVFIANVEIKCDSSDGRDLEYENMILCKADPLSMRDVTWWAALGRAGSAKPAWSNWSPFEQITQLLKARLFE